MDQVKIQSLKQELEVLKREKKFIQEKLDTETNKKLDDDDDDEYNETDRLLEIERSKADVAEKARA